MPAVQVFPAFRRRLRVSWLRGLALAALAAGQGDGSGRPRRVGLVVADDETVRGLNRSYRGLDSVTDVLAFSPTHGGHFEGDGAPPETPPVEFPQVGGAEEELGEVVLSFPQAQRQAAEAGHPVEAEVALLVVHGVLHLLGYDHVEPEAERLMQRKQEEALAMVKTPARARRSAPPGRGRGPR